MGLNKRIIPSLTTGAGSYVPETNKLAHLNVNDTNSYSGSGSTITDLTGNGYNGTISSAAYTGGSIGYLSFTGSSSSNVIINHQNTIYTPNFNDVSFMCWAYVTSTSYATLYSKGGSSGYYEVDVINGGISSGINYPHRAVFFRRSGSSVTSATSTVYPTYGVWFNLAATYDWTNQVVRLYKNGVKIATSSGWGWQASNYSTSGFTKIGGRHDGNHSWSGRFAEFKIFNAALSDAEQLATYNLNKAYYGH